MRKTTALLLILLLALAAAGCGDDEEATATTAAPAATTVAAGETVLTVAGTAFTMADLEALGAVTLTLEHPKNGATEYTGVRLNGVLALANIDAAATTLSLIASDGYSFDLAMADASACADCLISFNDEGGLNMAMPGMESKAWVKDVVEITAA